MRSRMEYVRETYGVPAKRGRLVEVYYKVSDSEWRLETKGRITSATNYIFVDGQPFHPTWGVVYLEDDGTVILDTRDNIRKNSKK